MIKYYRRAALLAFIAVVVTVAAGCGNTQTSASQCAYIVKNGYFDAKHLKKILHPGERKSSVADKDKVKYVYCNARNYIANADPDIRDMNVIAGKTGVNDLIKDGTPVFVEASAHFSLNQNEQVMTNFLAFCEKYNCFADKDEKNNGANAKSATPGWRAMLAENMRFAFQRATQVALLQFKPDVWNDQSKWPALGDAISAELKKQLQSQIGTTDDYFCGTAVTQSKCPNISVTIDTVTPQDKEFKNTYNKIVAQQQELALAKAEKDTNEAKLAAAEKKYGKYAEYFLGMQDVCSSAKNCIIGDPRSAVGG